MPPRPAVHPSKKEAVFQLCNFLCTDSIEKLQDLADGKILLETIQTKFSLFSNDCPSTSSAEEIKISEDKVDFIQIKEEPSDVNSKNEETNFNPAKEENDILLRFNTIQKFIDDHYEIDSETIISYDECRKSSELELIKVTVFVLSEIVKNLNDVNNEHLQTLFHLDIKFQIELEDIFKVFITERDTLQKNEIEKLLSKSAKNTSPIVTPRRASSRLTSLKELKSVSVLECSSAPNEDVFTNSPLKAYFESPIFKKEDMLKKNKEIKDLQEMMYAEDDAKQCRISEMEKELDKKDKDYKQLLKQNIQLQKQKNEEIELVKNSYESLSREYEKLHKQFNWDRDYYTNRIMELVSELHNAQKTLEEKEKQEELNRIRSRKSFSESHGNVSMSPPNKIEEAHRMEAVLKEKIKTLELKVYAYRKQLSERVLTELKEKKDPGNLSRSYEEVWNELHKDREVKGDILSNVIEEDNRNLTAKLNEAYLTIQNQNKEIEALKKRLTSKNRNSNQQKKVASVATVRDNASELLDSSKIPETERLRKSLSDSKNVEHYYDQSGESCTIIDESDNSIPSEQSIICSESEVIIPCPEKSSEGVIHSLWRMYDLEKPETGSTCGINFSHDSVAPENSHVDLINDLKMNNIKIENVEPDIIPKKEYKYVLGNLNFDVFLNELKKISKNGSFQKVLQVFGRRQNEINGTNRSNRLDLQELLKMITECVCVAVSLNSETSSSNLQDKCCSTDEKEFCGINQNIELNKLKNELTAASQKYEIELKEHKMELEELKKVKADMANQCQAYEQDKCVKSKEIERLNRKCDDIKHNLDLMTRNYIQYEELYNNMRVMYKKERIIRDDLKKQAVNLLNHYKKSKKENIELKKDKEDLRAERDKLLREKERQSISSAYSRDAFPPKKEYVGIPNHPSIKSELHSSTFQGTDNESVISSAFHKSISHYSCENEEDFFGYNSLDPIKKEYEDDRVEELKRRNSLYPIHLQSSYPLEADLETTYASLYVKDGEKVKEEHCSKKRKLDGTTDEEPSTSSTIETPVSKPKRKIGTPKSIQRIMKTIKYKNTYFIMKPKRS